MKKKVIVIIQIFFIIFFLCIIIAMLFRIQVFLKLQMVFEIPKKPIILGQAEIIPNKNWLFLFKTTAVDNTKPKLYGIYPSFLNTKIMNNSSYMNDEKAYVYQIIIPGDSREYRISFKEIDNSELINVQKKMKQSKHNKKNNNFIVNNFGNYLALKYQLQASNGIFIIIPQLKLSIYLNSKEILNRLNPSEFIRDAAGVR